MTCSEGAGTTLPKDPTFDLQEYFKRLTPLAPANEGAST